MQSNQIDSSRSHINTERLNLPNIDNKINNEQGHLALTLNKPKTLFNSNSMRNIRNIKSIRSGGNVMNTIESLDLIPGFDEAVKNKVIKTKNILRAKGKYYKKAEDRAKSVEPIQHSAKIIRDSNWGLDSSDRVIIDSSHRTPQKMEHKNIVRNIGIAY
jgi:hypothetical protein